MRHYLFVMLIALLMFGAVQAQDAPPATDPGDAPAVELEQPADAAAPAPTANQLAEAIALLLNVGFTYGSTKVLRSRIAARKARISTSAVAAALGSVAAMWLVPGMGIEEAAKLAAATWFGSQGMRNLARMNRPDSTAAS